MLPACSMPASPHSAPPQTPDSGAWQQLREAFDGRADHALTLAVYLLLGGLLAAYVRVLYRRTSRNPSADSVARVFPLLTLVTIAVISVVKSSLSLSLGLVGALSIVRFRAAIKDPEELVFLFLCIGIGLSLGAGQPWISMVLVGVASLFVLVFERFSAGRRAPEAFVTVVGPPARFAAGSAETALVVVEGAFDAVVLQRCDVDGDGGQLRAQVRAAPGVGAAEVMHKLQERLPDCEISYVDAGVLG